MALTSLCLSLAAIQTAVLALYKHPVLVGSGLKLLRSAREVKGMGSLDSVGKCVGKEIVNRVYEKLGELMDHASIDRVMEIEVRLIVSIGLLCFDIRTHLFTFISYYT